MTKFKLSGLNNAVVFVGSMLSADKDTGLPNGIRIADAVLGRILAKLEDAPLGLELSQERIGIIRAHARDTPFEQLFNAYPFDQDAREIFADTFGRGRPNIFHTALADAVRKKRVAAVVTTNYDTCLEQSLKACHLVFRQEHLTEGAGSARKACLFKIHGCASDPPSIIYRLKDEGALPEWKRKHLSRLVQGRDVVLLGYSGRDFDICPILLRCGYKNLFWVFPGSDLEGQLKWESQNARHVFGNPAKFPRAHAISGGFDAFFDAPRRFELTQTSGDIVARLFEKEARQPTEFAHWRASLLNDISCRIGTDAILAQLDPATRAEPRFIRLSSDSLERAGLYRDAIAEVRRWRAAIDRMKQPDAWLQSFVMETGRYYTAGYFSKAANALKRFRDAVASLKTEDVSFDEPLATAQETYLHLLMQKRIPAAIPLLGRVLYHALTCTIDIPKLQEAADFYYSRGLWQELHLIHQATSDFGITLDIGADSDRHFLLSAVDGFSQLNNLVGRAAAYRKSQARDRASCEDIVQGLWAYGHNPEYWKSFAAFRQFLSRDELDVACRRSIDALAQCQYSPLLTALNWFRLIRAAIGPLRRRRADEPASAARSASVK